MKKEGPDALVQLREPVNKFPEFVRYAVRLLKMLWPTMGKGKIAQMLCRAGLHLGTTTVGRMLKEIKPRFGKVGEQGSVALVERFILTMKLVLARLPLIPLPRESFRKELTLIIQWYNEHRPHDSLGGKTPNEVYETRFPANRKPRIEPRASWPRSSPCARPRAAAGVRPGRRTVLAGVR